MIEQIETVIVGGGQAGLATSYHLTQQSREHLVLEPAPQAAHVWHDERSDCTAYLRILKSAIGVVRGPLLIRIAGIGWLGVGVFTTDPIFGYPPSAPLVLAEFSTPGRLHDLFSNFGFLRLLVACFVFSRPFAALDKRG